MLSKSADTLRITQHTIQRILERTNAKDEAEAIRFAKHQYTVAKIVYRSHRYPDQLKIQNDDIVLCYHPDDHVIITAFISGHISL